MKKGVVLLCAVLLVIVYLAAGKEKCRDGKCPPAEVESIKLVCTELCARGGGGPAPFAEKTFRESSDIRIFTEAMGRAERILAEINYGVLFRMEVTYEDGTVKPYVLNVDRQQDGTGLLVDLAGSGQGYEIPRADSAELRRIIYTPGG